MMNRQFTVLCFLAILCLVGTNGAGVKRGVIMDYLGAEGIPIDINKIPVGDNVDFYFLLSFAIDSDRDGKPQNGVFTRYWADSLTPESILEVKKVHKNVKVMLSLAGWSIYTNEGKDHVIFWYDPKNEQLWMKNAVDSLTSLVKEYHLDGIDIDYEKIPQKSRFAPLIGELITTLKQAGTIEVASISPYTETNWHYAQLFQNFSSAIDFVSYQFYSELATKPSEVVARYNELAKTYTFGKIVPGYEVNGIGLQGANFTDALQLIKKEGHELVGVMIYSADRGLKNGFAFEKEFQALF